MVMTRAFVRLRIALALATVAIGIALIACQNDSSQEVSPTSDVTATPTPVASPEPTQDGGSPAPTLTVPPGPSTPTPRPEPPVVEAPHAATIPGSPPCTGVTELVIAPHANSSFYPEELPFSLGPGPPCEVAPHICAMELTEHDSIITWQVRTPYPTTGVVLAVTTSPDEGSSAGVAGQQRIPCSTNVTLENRSDTEIVVEVRYGIVAP